MQNLIDTNLIPVLQAFDKARELLQGFKTIHLPSIIVVGDQASGKSSLLQSICQVQLPKGQNCVTKCPLIIQLRNQEQKQSTPAITVWIEGQQDALTSKNLKESGNFILQKTAELADQEQDSEIYEKPIYIKISKPGSVDLTLIDLPGLNYTGNKAPIIRALIQKYIENENAIILLVIPANVDTTSSQAIEMASKVDRQSSRSILVLTKVDLCEKNFANNFKSNILKLKLGTFAVRNRTQSQLDQGVTLEQQRKIELQLFKKHEELRNLPQQQIGIQNLISKIVELQRRSLLTCKPRVIKQVQQKLKQQESDFSQLPAPCSDKFQLQRLFKLIMDDFKLDMDKSIDAKYGQLGQEFYIRPALHDLYHNNFQQLLKIGSQFQSEDVQQKIQNHIKTTAGRYLPNFIDPSIVSIFVNEFLEKVRACQMDLIQEVSNKIQQYLKNLVQRNFKRFEQFANTVICQIQAKIEDCKKQVIKQLDFAMQIEQSGPITVTPHYQMMLNDMRKQIEGRRIAKQNQQNQQKKYDQTQFQIAKDQFLDQKIALLTGKSQDNYLRSNQAFELNVTLQAYWSVFIERFADSFYMKLTFMFLLRFSRQIKDYIDRMFNPNGDGEYAYFTTECLSDSRQLISQRREYVQNIEKLEEALKLMKKLH